MKKELKERIEKHTNHGINKYTIEYSIEKFAYKIKMFWLQRNHRLNEEDIPLIIWVTNKFIYKEDILPENYKPSHRKKDLFKGDELNSNLEKIKKELFVWYMDNYFIKKKPTMIEKIKRKLVKRKRKKELKKHGYIKWLF